MSPQRKAVKIDRFFYNFTYKPWSAASGNALQQTYHVGYHNTTTCGGAASTTDGHFIAFGNTEEALRAVVLGQTAHGAESEGPFDRRTGRGWVRAEDGQYADALAKGHPVVLLGMETSGAFFSGLTLLLLLLGRQSTAPGTHDSTVYGEARASTKAYSSATTPARSRRRSSLPTPRRC